MTPETERRRLLKDLLEPALASLGLCLWGMDLHLGGGRGLVRIYVEGATGEPVDVDQIARASRHLSVLLDVEDLIPGAYTLEVSSPGLERPFFHPAQMTGYQGRDVEVRLREPLGLPFPGRKRLNGRLLAVEGETLRLLVDAEELIIDWPSVHKARLLHNFPQPRKKGG